jgi:ATP synthase protein I
MSELPGPQNRRDLSERVRRKEARKMRARRRKDRRIWFGLGMFGLVGWSVALPTLIGLAVGIWIDATWPQIPYSFTLMGLIGGLLAGLYSAWHWVNSEGNIIEREEKDEKSEHE